MRKSSQVPSQRGVFERLAAQRRARFVAQPAFPDEDKINHFRDGKETSAFAKYEAKRDFRQRRLLDRSFPPISFIGTICGVDMLTGKLFTSSLDMKRILWISALLTGVVLATHPFEAKGAEGLVLNERVNVRARPSLTSEVICQLNTGSRVQILDSIRSENPQPGEPKEWYRIQAPSQATLWVSSQYIDPDTHAVTASRLNVRVGKGTNFSVVGRIERNTIVKPIRSLAGWTAIQPLPGTEAYLAAEFVDLIPEKETESSVPESPSQAPPIVSDEEIPEIIIDDPEETEPGPSAESGTKTPQAQGGQTLPPPIYTEEPFPEDSESPSTNSDLATAAQPPAEKPNLSLSEEASARLKRIITRDGIVRRVRNIQAPAYHRLEDPRTGTTINYLHTGELEVDLRDGREVLKSYEGFKIRVIGEESVDARWPGIPVIEIEKLRVLE